jgi:hypothetical protein
MKRENIRSHIDKKIIDKLKEMDYYETRQNLLDVSRRFSNRLSPDIKIDNENFIGNIENSKEKYLAEYVFWAHKRIIDLYKIEIMDICGFNSVKKFKALRFKEKMEINNNIIS